MGNLMVLKAVSIGYMKGYVNIPKTIYVKRCKECGARPIIAIAAEGGYVVKCPKHDHHYHTEPGLIDLDDWNHNNKMFSSGEQNLNTRSSVQQ